MFRLGVDSFIWTENFTEKDLWIISKAKELGFETIDIFIANIESFPMELVKKEVEKTDIEVVTTYGLSQNPKPIIHIPKKGQRELGL